MLLLLLLPPPRRRFDLTYQGADGEAHRPVIVHRAILGSFERMLAILAEHTGGRWPLWLSPRQVLVLPVAERHAGYADEVRAKLARAGMFADVAPAGRATLKKRVREAWQLAYNYVLVVGDEEAAEGTVHVRPRDGGEAAAAAGALVDLMAAGDAAGADGGAASDQDVKDLLAAADELGAASLDDMIESIEGLLHKQEEEVAVVEGLWPLDQLLERLMVDVGAFK